MSRYKTKLSSQQILYRVAAVVAMLGVIGGTVWWAVSTKSSVKQIEAQRDERTQCLTAVSGLITVLVDRTDAMNENQLESVRSAFQFIKKSIRKDERLAVYPIDAEASAVPATLIEVCAPVSEQDASALTENLKRVKKRFDEAFSKPLDEVLVTLKAQKTEKQSPILEAIQSVAASQPEINKRNSQIRRELIMFSDLLQHSQRASLYRVAANTDTTRLLETPSIKEVLNDTKLVGYDVKIYMLERCGYSEQQRVARAFWEKAFKSAGAINTSFPALPTPQKPCPGGKTASIEAPPPPSPILPTKPVVVPKPAQSEAPKPQASSVAQASASRPAAQPAPPTKPVLPTPPTTQAPTTAPPTPAPMPPVAAPAPAPPARVMNAREECRSRPGKNSISDNICIYKKCEKDPLHINTSFCKEFLEKNRPSVTNN
jgi:hypothetical protein